MARGCVFTMTRLRVGMLIHCDLKVKTDPGSALLLLMYTELLLIAHYSILHCVMLHRFMLGEEYVLGLLNPSILTDFDIM